MLGLAVLAVCAPWWNIPRDQADSAGMLAHLHAYFVDGDLLYDNEYARLGMSPLFAFVTDEGVVSNHWPAGAAWLQLPGYALGLLAARVLAALQVGSSSPLGVVVVLSVRAWACLVGVVVVWRVGLMAARAASGDRDRESTVGIGVGVAVASIFAFGTPLAYYIAEAPLRPHLWGAAVTLALVHVWAHPEIAAGRPYVRTLLMALLVGLAATVRPQLAPLALLVVADAAGGADRLADRLPRVAFAVAVTGVWPLVHLRTQLWIYGAGLGDYAGEVTVHLRHFLLSPHHGLLAWCPVVAVGLFAVVRAAVRRERGGLLIAGLLAHQLWLDAGMRPIAIESVLGTRTWAGGTGFAARKIVDVLPLMLPAVASLIAAGRGQRWSRPLLGVCGVLCLPTLALHAAAFVSPDATTGALIGSFAALRAVMALPLSADAWTSAFAARTLPLAVPAVISVAVTLPLAVAALRTRQGLRAAPTDRRGTLTVDLSVGALLLGAVAAHLWLSVLQVRSDAALLEAPERMRQADAVLAPRHRATVAQIPRHHAAMRAALGDDAAP
ncbi:MAG: hypothetical protein AAF721_21230 [Myxococcota bacterium]